MGEEGWAPHTLKWACGSCVYGGGTSGAVSLPGSLVLEKVFLAKQQAASAGKEAEPRVSHSGGSEGPWKQTRPPLSSLVSPGAADDPRMGRTVRAPSPVKSGGGPGHRKVSPSSRKPRSSFLQPGPFPFIIHGTAEGGDTLSQAQGHAANMGQGRCLNQGPLTPTTVLGAPSSR